MGLGRGLGRCGMGVGDGGRGLGPDGCGRAPGTSAQQQRDGGKPPRLVLRSLALIPVHDDLRR